MSQSPVLVWNQNEQSPQFFINIVQSPSMDSNNGSPSSFYESSTASPGNQYHQFTNLTSPAYSGNSTPTNLNLLMTNASPSVYFGDTQTMANPSNLQNYIYAQPSTSNQPTPPTNTMVDFAPHQSIQNFAPRLEILEQPEGENRFRYKSEMNGSKHGSLYGISSSKKGKKKTYPTVRVVDGFGQITLRCSLSQIPSKIPGKYSPHSHKLSRKSNDRNGENGSDYCDIIVHAQNGYQASFEGIGIIHTIRENIADVLNAKKKIDMQLKLQRLLTNEELKQIRSESDSEVKTVELNKVVLRFQALCKDEGTGSYREICEPVYSNIIKNEKGALTGRLKIVRIKDDFSEAKGGSEHFLLVKKVSKTDIHVRFYELDENSEIAWTEVVKVPETNVHHQFALILEAPPYWKQDITAPVTVFIELFRSADGCKSANFPFTYIPNKISEPNRKRTRKNDAFIPDVVTDFMSSNQMPIVPTYQQATQNLEYTGSSFAQGGGQCEGYLSEHDSCLSDSQENAFTMDFSVEFFNNLSHPVMNTEDFNKLAQEFHLDFETGLGPKIETDAVVEHAQDDTKKLGLSEYIKIKSLVEAFIDDWSEKQIQTTLVKILEKNDEHVLFALIGEDCLNELQELAIILHKYKLLRYLHEKNEVNQNCLHFAVLNRKHHMIAPLMAMGLDVNLIDQNGDTPLSLAVNENHIESVQKLVENKKLKIDLMNHKGSTALHIAVRNGKLEIAKLLIESGASYKAKNPKNGNNLLHEAVTADPCSTKMIKYLLKINNEFFKEDTNHSDHRAQRLAIARPCNEDVLELFKVEDDISESMSSLQLTEQIEKPKTQKIFDDQCIKDLSKILDRDDQWHVLALLLGFEGMVNTWQSLPSPTMALLFYLELQAMCWEIISLLYYSQQFTFFICF